MASLEISNKAQTIKEVVQLSSGTGVNMKWSKEKTNPFPIYHKGQILQVSKLVPQSSFRQLSV